MSRPGHRVARHDLPATAAGGGVALSRTRPRRRNRGLLLWLALLIAGLVAGLAAWGYQLRQGMEVTNMRNLGVWGLYISFFMYFVGLAGGGLVLACSGGMLRATRLRPFVRLAFLQATVTIIVAALFLLPDIGRPDRLWNILIHPNFASPMVWDFVIVVVCLLISLIGMWAYTRADLAGRGSALAFGTGASPADSRRDERLRSALAAVGLPAGILLISIDAWIFGLQISRGFWYSAIMAPLFIASGLVSATALLIVLALVVRRIGRLAVGNEAVTFLAMLLAIFVAVEAFLVFAELLTAAYPGAGFEADPVARLLTGRYGPFFWFEIVAGLALPFVLLVVPRWRTKMVLVAGASVLALVGVFAHRLTIVMNGLSEAGVALPPGAPTGPAPLAGTGSFALSLFYYPSLVEWLVALGLICLGALLFTGLAVWLPLREETR